MNGYDSVGDNVRVFLRVCPLDDLEATSESCIEILDENKSIKVNLATSPDDEFECNVQFDKIFDGESTEEEIYNTIGSPLVKEFLLGNNCCIFTYGESGTGKTHTLVGSNGYDYQFNDDISSLSSCGVSEAPRRKPHIYNSTKQPVRLLNLPDDLRKPIPPPRLKNGRPIMKHPNRLSKNIYSKNLSPLERMMHANQNHMNNLIGAHDENDAAQDKFYQQNMAYQPRRNDKGILLFDGLEDAMAKNEFESVGILPFIVKNIFDNIFNEIMVRFSMYEIDHEENLHDLLGPKELAGVLPIRENADGIYVEGITQVGCTTESQVMGLIERGVENRSIFYGSRSNYDNNFFRRSHVVFEITSEYYDAKREIELTNSFRIVDISGFENPMIGAANDRDRILFNKSLGALSCVVNGLADAQRDINYSDSKLTHILQDRLNGDCKTALIITASPSHLHVTETMKTLQFGKQTRKVKRFVNDDLEEKLSKYKAKLEMSEKTRLELMEIMTELEKKGVKVPKRRSVFSMTSILEEEDDSLGSYKSEKKSPFKLETLPELDLEKLQNETNTIDLNSDENDLRMEDDLANAREELKNLSVLLRSASERMDMDLNVVKKMVLSKVGISNDDRKTELTAEEIDENIELAKKNLLASSRYVHSSTKGVEKMQGSINTNEKKKVEEKEAALKSLEKELNIVKKENTELKNKVKTQEDDLTAAKREIQALKITLKTLEESSQDILKANIKHKRSSEEPKKSFKDRDFEINTKSQYLSTEDADYDPIEDEDFIRNDVIQKKDSMRVCLRIRPMTKYETNRRSRDCFTVHQGSQMFTIDSPMDGGQHDFTYDKIFDSKSSQEMIYDYVGAPIVNDLLSGINCSLIAYGLKNSGRTTTLFGAALASPDHASFDENASTSQMTGNDAEIGEEYGIIPRIVKGLFKEIPVKGTSQEFNIRCSFVAIYLEKIFDLLDPGGDVPRYVEEDEHGVKINGACRSYCFDEIDLFALVLRGLACHSTLSAYSKLNPDGSILLFIVDVEQKNLKTGLTKIARLHVADIFGFDPHSNQTGNDSKRLQHSFHTLASVIDSVVEGKKNVPYKDSKLTHILKEAFGGNSKTTFIVTASPSSYTMSNTVKTIRFGYNVRQIKNSPRVNIEHGAKLLKKWLVATEIKLGELSAFVMDLAHNMIANKAFSKIISSQLWKSIIAIVREEEKLWNPCREKMVIGKEDFEKLDFKWKTLSRYLSKNLSGIASEENGESIDEIKSLLFDAQCEVHVLKTQIMLQRLETAKKKEALRLVEYQLRSTKLKISKLENNLGLSEFRKNVAISIALHLRKLCWRLQHDYTQGRSSELESLHLSTEGMPDLSGLVVIDSVLYGLGFINTREVDNDQDDQTFKNMRSMCETQSSSGDTENRRSSFKKMFSGRSLLMDEDNSKSDIETRSSFGPFIMLQNAGGVLKKLSTPPQTDEGDVDIDTTTKSVSSKPIDWARAEEENEKNEMTRKLLEYKVKLTEEQSHVDLLSNRSGPLLRKNLSQEVIKLRREKTNLQNDLRASACKLQEIQIVNELLERQTVESQRQIMFLENDFDDLQSIFKETIAESHEKETQIYEELRKVEKYTTRLLEPRIRTEKVEEFSDPLPKMNVAPLGASESSKIKNQILSQSSLKLTDSFISTVRATAKDPEKIAHKALSKQRSAKYSRRSRHRGNVIAGINKEKTLKAFKRSIHQKLPAFKGVIKLQESRASLIARNSYFAFRDTE